MKHLFIINPAAGSYNRTEEASPVLHEICRRNGLDYEVRVSTAPGECCSIAAEAIATGEELRIYACGGDGTLNEIVQAAAGHDNVAVTTYCGGSGNDFVKLFSDPKAFRDLERLLDAEVETFDLIDCNGDLSLNICSVGLDARIGTDVTNYKRLPLLHGHSAYIASMVINVIRGIHEHYVVEIDGERVDARQTMICACNGRFYGGGFNPVPEADPTDGLMDVLLVKHVSRLQVPGVIGKYKNGQYKKLPKLVRHFKTDHVRIICDKPTAINLDGELRVSETVDFRIAQQKLRFFYPKGLTYAAKEPVNTK